MGRKANDWIPMAPRTKYFRELYFVLYCFLLLLHGEYGGDAGCESCLCNIMLDSSFYSKASCSGQRERVRKRKVLVVKLAVNTLLYCATLLIQGLICHI
mmetsp:Transcript_2743/g.4075  ORF Transcript_2743/g.4075 Transcript_2743/m.4075 type:complete len:99 (+) Transcript_2743:1033-1329(+)